MIVDANFKVYVVYRNGEKHSVMPQKRWIENLIAREDREGDTWNTETYTITTNDDLARLIEDEVDDERLQHWEKASLNTDHVPYWIE